MSQTFTDIAGLPVFQAVVQQLLQALPFRLLHRQLLQLDEVGHQVGRDVVDAQEQVKPADAGIQLALFDPDQGGDR